MQDTSSRDEVKSKTAHVASSGNSWRVCFAVVVGVGLFLSGLLISAFGEWEGACAYQAFSAAHVAVVSASCSVPAKAYRRLLVHVSCPLGSASMPLWTSEDFGLPPPILFEVLAASVDQRRSIYQCVEEDISRSGNVLEILVRSRAQESKTSANSRKLKFRYSLRWLPRPAAAFAPTLADPEDETLRQRAIQSACGGAVVNNHTFPYLSRRQQPRLTVGPFNVSHMVPQLSRDTVIELAQSKAGDYRVPGYDANATVAMQEIFIGCLPGNPKLGCVRMSFHAAAARSLSHLAEVTDDGGMMPWVAPTGWFCAGYRDAHGGLELTSTQRETSQEMLDDAYKPHVRWSLVLRCIVAVLTYLGLRVVFSNAVGLASLTWSAEGDKRQDTLFTKVTRGVSKAAAAAADSGGFLSTSIFTLQLSLPFVALVSSAAWVSTRPFVALPVFLLSLLRQRFVFKSLCALADAPATKEKAL